MVKTFLIRLRATLPLCVLCNLTASASLPSPWLDQDIGAVGLNGTAAYSNGVFQVSASGADIWNTSDGFHYVYQPLVGDGQISARVLSVSNSDPWAKAGVMIRGSTASSSQHAAMLVTPARGVTFQRRMDLDGFSEETTISGINAPYWVRVVRRGTTLSGYISSNGLDWVFVDGARVPMPCDALMGLAVTAHNNTALNVSSFDNVSVVNLPSAVSIISPEPDAGFMLPTNITIVADGCDTNGAVQQVEFYEGTNKLGESVSSPYEVAWTNAHAADYVLTARATDSAGNRLISTQVKVTILSSKTFNATYLKREVYRDLGGYGLGSLTNSPKFPDHPDFVGFVRSFESPSDVGDFYGQRLSGFLVPGLTGEHVFYINSDDEGALYLSPDETPVNKVLIASETVWNGPGQWVNGQNQASRGSPPANISTNIFLEAGRKYYVEALMHQRGGGDNLAVTWRIPGGPVVTNGAPPIAGEFLGTGNPYSLKLFRVGNDILISWTVTGVVLEQAVSLSGPWTIATAVSPFTVTSLGQQRFYRLRKL
jgi:hypothetical protein